MIVNDDACAVDVVNDGLRIAVAHGGAGVGVISGALDVLLELGLGVLDRKSVEKASVVGVDLGSQIGSVRVDGLEVGLDSGGVTANDSCGRSGGKEDDVADGDHFDGLG